MVYSWGSCMDRNFCDIRFFNDKLEVFVARIKVIGSNGAGVFSLNKTPKPTPEQIKQPKPEEDLQNESDQIVLGSRVIAERFGKRHDNVYRDIESLLKIEDIPKKYFTKSLYNMNKTNSGIQNTL